MIKQDNINDEILDNQVVLNEDGSVDVVEKEDKESRKKSKPKIDVVDDYQIPVQMISAACESMLFVSGEPISISRMEEITNVDKTIIQKAMDKLILQYENNPWGGLLIRKIEETYVMCTKPELKEVVDRMFMPRMRPPLSQASYETLAVIAYNQPVTRAQVEAVRGVSSDSIISRLLDRGWICESGVLDAPGRPTLFSTTNLFLMEFGISSADELPSMELMSYKSIRDLENSLEEAAGSNDRQISIDTLIEKGQANNDEHNKVN